MSSQALAELYDLIQADRRRVTHPFSDDIPIANALLHNPAAYDDELHQCLRFWCQDQQPCQFGRAAVRDDRIHFCVIREPAIVEWRDDELSDAIGESKRLWKQRAAYDPERAAHSFVLVFASPRLAIAAPDANLRAFAERALELTGWTKETRSRRRRNTISSDHLYLRNPHDGQFYGFQFNIDFFACAGDRRWWHDHRFPGGIAFTANSTGHMRFHREWYSGNSASAGEWAVKQAMLTIANAVPTKRYRDLGKSDSQSVSPQDDGCVTWLRETDSDGRPFLADVPCPLSKVPNQLEGKDWTRYEGYLHTDHAVREEFFLDRETPPTRSAPYLMDLTYLYDEDAPDFVEFTAGIQVPETAIHAEIGDPSTWSHRGSVSCPRRTAEDDRQIAQQLNACRTWVTPGFARLDE